MLLEFVKSGCPIFRATTPLSKSKLKSKGHGKLSIHFAADQETIETVSHNYICQSVREFTVCPLTQTTLKTPDARSWMTSLQKRMICFPLRRESRFHLFSRNGLNAQRVRATTHERQERRPHKEFTTACIIHLISLTRLLAVRRSVTQRQ